MDRCRTLSPERQGLEATEGESQRKPPPPLSLTQLFITSLEFSAPFIIP